MADPWGNRRKPSSDGDDADTGGDKADAGGDKAAAGGDNADIGATAPMSRRKRRKTVPCDIGDVGDIKKHESSPEARTHKNAAPGDIIGADGEPALRTTILGCDGAGAPGAQPAEPSEQQAGRAR
jgi:hypothetical protein